MTPAFRCHKPWAATHPGVKYEVVILFDYIIFCDESVAYKKDDIWHVHAWMPNRPFENCEALRLAWYARKPVSFK